MRTHIFSLFEIRMMNARRLLPSPGGPSSGRVGRFQASLKFCSPLRCLRRVAKLGKDVKAAPDFAALHPGYEGINPS
jgi:hypothetical protein